jgi:hypothetical protein
MTQSWLESPETFKKHIEEQGGFDESIGLTPEVARNYQNSLFAGSTREDALYEATKHLHLNAVTAKYISDILENLPAPGEI